MGPYEVNPMRYKYWKFHKVRGAGCTWLHLGWTGKQSLGLNKQLKSMERVSHCNSEVVGPHPELSDTPFCYSTGSGMPLGRR